MKQIQHWVDGAYVAGASGRSGPVFNPATGDQTGEVALASSADVERAVIAAGRAFETWRYSSLTQRQNIMFAFRELVAARRKEIAAVLTSEHGKTLDDALGEVQRGLEVVEFACNIAHLLKGDFSEQVSTGVDTYTIRQPLGVVAGITPFNFPAMVPMWMYPIAIACGNTFILKPSEKDPSVSQLAAEMLTEAGLPDGVFNVVHGDKEAVDALITHPGVAAVSFVGSTPIARYIYETGTSHGKRVQALGGAKNHMIVLPDADMDLAADAAVSAGYGSAGERCMAISAVVAVGEAGDELIEGVRTRIEKLTVGPGDQAGSRWAHWSRNSTSRRSAGMSTPVRPRALSWSPTGADSSWKAMRRGSSSARPCSTTSSRRCRSTPTRSSARCCPQSAWSISRTPFASSTRTPTGTGRRCSPTTVELPESSSRRSRWGWWGSTCRSRCRCPSTASAVGRTRSSGPTPSTGPRVSISTPGRRWSSPVGRPDPPRCRPRLPHARLILGMGPRTRRNLAVLGVVVALIASWEIYKLTWSTLGWIRPVRPDDVVMPHVWDMVIELFRPVRRGGNLLILDLAGRAFWTMREAIVGFLVGGLLGFGIGVWFVRSRLAERAFMPYVVASQTVPILAIAPMVVVFGLSIDVPGWISVASIAAFLTFFPVAINTLRGLRSPDPNSLE